jgi:hypothetical protein
MAPSQNPDTTHDTSQSMTPEQLQAEITSGLTTADGAATQGISDLKLVHQARVSQLTRTAASLTAKLGAGDPLAQAAQAALAAEKATVARVSMVHQQVSTAAPQVTATGWAHHGRVFNAQMQPVAGYTVFLVDAQKTFQQDYGFSYTDNTGYFLINYPGSPAGAQTGALTTNAQTSAAAPQLFVEIANANAQPVYLSPTPFQPAPGSAAYRNIALPAGEKPIGDPPAAIRNIAFPGRKKS